MGTGSTHHDRIPPMTSQPQPLNQKTVRVGNAWRVLEYVRTSGPTSRAKVAAETGLTVTTVHRLVADLRRRRLLGNGTTAEYGGVGRPAETFQFNAGVGHVVGIDVGNETTRAGLANLDGRIIADDLRPTAEIAADLPGGLEAVVGRLQRSAGVQSGSLVALSVGVPGVIDLAGGVIVRASLHRPWDGLPLGSQLRRSLGVEVVVAQDDHLTALAELRRGACVGLHHALVVNVGKGIGAGIIVDGQPYYGSHAAAGRLGWFPMPLGDDAASRTPDSIFDDSSDPTDRTDPAVAPASQLVTADGLIADYRRLGGRVDAPGAIDVFGADEAGDPAAARAIDLFADRLGGCIGMAVALMDPQRVVIGGGISGSFDRLAPRLTERLSRVVLLPPSVVPSQLGTEAGVIGAIEAAMERADAWLLDAIAR